MKNRSHRYVNIILVIVAGLAALLVLIINATIVPVTPLPGRESATPTSIWEALLVSTPLAYSMPLPESVTTPLDGLYAKVDQSWPQWWLCRRCADYRAAGGIWKLQFTNGIMRIFYEVNGWRSIASYTISGDRLHLFNDPYCPKDVGEYKWRISNGELELEVVDDPCSFGLRAENFSKQEWLSCADEESPGCVENQSAYQDSTSLPDSHLTVTVYGGDSRFFTDPPDMIVHANAKNNLTQNRILISYAEEAIPYGLNYVLWWNGRWIEASVDDVYDAIGVQFLGDQAFAWLRVLFDGEEVWRGDASAIWSKDGRYGCFIEISGFAIGQQHVIRVETLEFDYHPITVASFGFSYGTGVQP